jgi:hypothetical protein
MYNQRATSNTVKTAAKKIKDRGIHWEENYHDKSLSLKKAFDRKVGPKSYLRWQGHDVTTNSDYYIIVGPSVQNDKNMFFAGIKKLPRDPEAKIYSPYGEYFGSIRGAMSYATKKWGVPFMNDLPPYDESTIANVDIPEHIKGSVVEHNYKYGLPENNKSSERM